MKSILEFPDDARAWVYALDREVTAAEQRRLRDILNTFVDQWNSHGEPVTGAWSLVERRFIILAGYCTAGIGGCSTDSSVRAVHEVENALGVNAFDRTLVFFRDNSETVHAVAQAQFQAYVNEGRVTGSTRVFDPTITTVGELRTGRFERPLRDSWHARAFSSPR